MRDWEIPIRRFFVSFGICLSSGVYGVGVYFSGLSLGCFFGGGVLLLYGRGGNFFFLSLQTMVPFLVRGLLWSRFPAFVFFLRVRFSSVHRIWICELPASLEFGNLKHLMV
jgi:hypothetical protein